MASFKRFSIGAAAVTLPLVAALGFGQREQKRFDGEYGLYVWESRDSVVVQWISKDAAVGSLRVLANGKVIHQRSTPAHQSHRAAFRTKEDVLTLELGSDAGNDDRHVVVVDRKPRRPSPVMSAPDSLYVFGDTHGNYDGVVHLLRVAGLLDANLSWSGGRKQLVFLGDILDRGADATRLLWLVYRIEREAQAQGGRVHTILGNHEIMVMLGDLRYVHAKEQELARLHDVAYPALFDPRASLLGRWLSTKPAVLKMGDLLLAHGGVSSDYTGFTVKSHADSVAALIGRPLFYSYADSAASIRVDSVTLTRFQEFFWGDRSVFWYRGYLQTDTMGAELDSVLRAYGVSVQVVGHTPQETIGQRYGGKLIVAHPRTPAAEMLVLTRGPARKYTAQRLLPSGELLPLSN